MAKERYYLMPGVTICKDGLPGKKLECKKGAEPMKIDEKHVEIIKKNIGFLISQKKVVTSDELEAAKEEKADAGKSEKRLALETEAKELGLDFNTKTSGKELEEMIAAELEK